MPNKPRIGVLVDSSYPVLTQAPPQTYSFSGFRLVPFQRARHGQGSEATPNFNIFGATCSGGLASGPPEQRPEDPKHKVAGLRVS